VESEGANVLKFYTDRAAHYKGQMDKQKSKRSKTYSAYFKYVVLIVRVLDVGFAYIPSEKERARVRAQCVTHIHTGTT